MNEKILHAKEIDTKVHNGQTDKSGALYIKHPETVAGMIAGFGRNVIKLD